jgi:RNA polymerase sigma factor (sigma-70 family)
MRIGYPLVSDVGWSQSRLVTEDVADPGAAMRTLEEIYRAEIGRLASLGTTLVGDPSAGEDLAHDTFVQLAARLRRDHSYVQGPAWPLLRTMIVRLALKRRRALTRELLRLARSWQPPAEPRWEPDPSLLDWHAALQSLPPRMRATVVLFYAEDLSTVDVASQLGCSPRTVENQLRRARQRLAAALPLHEDMKDG